MDDIKVSVGVFIFVMLQKKDIRRKDKDLSIGLCNEKACKYNLWNDEE